MNLPKVSAIIKNPAARSDFWTGIKDSAPIMVGVIPFGITCGLMGISAGLTSWETLAMSLIVFAGASQFVAITMLAGGVSSAAMIIFATWLINLRHLLMGASLAPYLNRYPLPLQALLCFGMADETYALTVARIAHSGYSVVYQFSVNTSLYVTWALSTAVGTALGNRISDPLAWGLDFAMPATFLVLLIPRLMDKPGLMACLTAAVVSVWGAVCLPGKWYIIIAALSASLVGGIMEGENKNAQ